MGYKLVKDLLDLLDEFEVESGSGTVNMDTFTSWLANRQIVQLALETGLAQQSDTHLDSQLNDSIKYVSRYAKFYTKSALQQSVFATADELSYLLFLQDNGPLNKTALIKQQVQEKSAGIQIINRLLAMNLVEQKPDRQDKRNKIIQLTPVGIEAIALNKKRMEQANEQLLGSLSAMEKKTLKALLNKLEVAHKELFNETF